MSRVNPYPALAAWRRRDGNKPESQWTYDDLWRAAMAEVEAIENRNHPEREQQLQREAMALLLGEPLHNVRPTRDAMRRYLAALATYEQKGAA